MPLLLTVFIDRMKIEISIFKSFNFQNDMQFREKGHVSVDSTDFGTKHESQQLHRLASMRHYQALIQNKPGNGQNEVSICH